MAPLWISALGDRVARRIGVWAGIAYMLLYLYSLGHILIDPGADVAFGRPVPSADLIPDWSAKVWKPVAPFVWEPIAAIYPLRSVAIFLSMPNLLLALLLGTLVALNLTAAIARARLMTGGVRRGSVRGLLASLPALLTGFACCVPTVILALGSLAAGFAVAAITVAPYLLPAAVLALILNLFWSFRQYGYVCAVKPSPNN